MPKASLRALALASLVCALCVSPAAASRAPDFESLARAALARDDLGRDLVQQELVLDRIVVGREGALVRFSQTYLAWPVEGSAVLVRLDAHGSAVYVVADGVVRARTRTAFVPALDADSAVEIARGRLDVDRAGAASLVILPKGDGARLAYRVSLSRGASLTGYVALVAADTGALLGARETAIAFDTGSVFEENPVKTPSLMSVTLGTVTSESTLVGELSAVSCVDTGMCLVETAGDYSYRCAPSPRAMRDGSGDFLYPRPVVDTDPLDPFAEVQAFFHAKQALEHFRVYAANPALTFEDATQIRVNVLSPSSDRLSYCGTSTTPNPAVTLEPLDNAFFSPADDALGDPPVLAFGQGERVDFAYDGDVVFHEVGHAVQAEVAAIGPYYAADAFGTNGDTGALSEGFADYWSSVMTGEPELGEYVALAVDGAPAGSALRSLAGTLSCPDDLIGEGHEDGKIWGSALWAIRSATPAQDRDTFDHAMFMAFATNTAESTMQSMAGAVEAELGLALGETARASAHSVFEARGLFTEACEQRILPVESDQDRFVLIGPPRFFGGTAGGAPSVTQLSITLAEKTKTLAVTAFRAVVGVSKGDFVGSPKASLLVKCGDGPIVWSGEPRTHDADFVVPFIFTGDVTGDTGRATAVLSEKLRPGVCHLQILNEHPQLFVFALVGVTLDGGSLPAGGDDGCGCHVRPSRAPRSTLTLALLFVAALTLRRARARTR